MYFDSHAHYDDKRFDNDRHELLLSLKENGVDYVVNIGADMKSSKESINLANKYDFIYATVGVHPHDVKNMTEKDLDILEEYTKEKKVVALGEIGLDYYYNHSEKDEQRFWFGRQLELANKVGLPVIIHSRDADEECYEIIKKSNINNGVIHCFSGSKEMAKKYIDLGFKIGIGGVVTFKNARKIIETVENIGVSHILIETDCPYLAPEPYRGQRNSSIYLKEICQKIGEIKKINHDEVAYVTSKNALSFYKIK